MTTAPPGNRAVLETIRRHKPESMLQLATLTRRKEASLSRTFKRLAELGITGFKDGPTGQGFPPS